MPNGLRELINKKPWIGGLFLTLVVAAAAWALWPAPKAGAFFTDDDGKTFFRDSGNLIPPFTRNGKEVVAAVVYVCEGSDKQFVGYLQRYTPEGKTQIEEKLKRNDPRDDLMPDYASYEVKKPSVDGWVSQPKPGPAVGNKPNSLSFQSITNVTCPDGKARAIRYLPE